MSTTLDKTYELDQIIKKEKPTVKNIIDQIESTAENKVFIL